MSGPLIAAVEMLARSGRTFEARISGVSMGHTIPDGSLVRIEPVTRAAPGDVIAFRERDRIVAHRVRFRARAHLLLLGDGYTIPDIPVKETSVIGRVAALELRGQWHEVPARSGRSVVATVSVALVGGALLVSPRLAARVAGVLIALRRYSGRTSNA
jgi:hypothetical protein